MSKRKILIALVTLLLVAGASALATRASASGKQKTSRSMLVGVFDDTITLGVPDRGFTLVKASRAQLVRITLWWGGPMSVATKRPAKATDPDDPAYVWTAYDHVVQLAKKNNVKVLFSISGTPGWANGRKSAKVAPKNFRDLQNFAVAAAKRYSGTFTPAGLDTALPAVRLWLAWNEPNNPVFLSPQYKKTKKGWVIQSAKSYVGICNAIFKGVHSVQGRAAKVGCGATDPFGNNQPRSRRPSVSPLAFLRAVKKYGLRKFDAWAHHPYAGRPTETPTTKPRAKTSVTLGNFGDLVKELTRLYGKKRVWITEYGYQTRPPDRAFGVAWKTQAKYMSQAFSIARKNPRVDMMVWYLIRDERRLSGWQSGLLTYGWKAKPAYTTYRRLKH